ncbi:UPF0342 protein [Bacillus cereus]|nr:UPF0342 protein [Bacillus cereus]
MTKNIHDVAYELQKAIAENDDFKTLKESYAAVQADGRSFLNKLLKACYVESDVVFYYVPVL